MWHSKRRSEVKARSVHEEIDYQSAGRIEQSETRQLLIGFVCGSINKFSVSLINSDSNRLRNNLLDCGM
jgi:hypothetical protein